ncbi:receptor expression-enhancing protein 5-like [Daktulosphaira vitifoliae]|uniref:receptor expression-enhancing protein 5-like n=1 Tax=Daktulosphaira vitifoliae TaxID=58002 RepID=UPI0021A9AC40|nr:receptor expression-enhancing protein 5-like [Daktulosphaira vitifoliae]
MSGQIENIKSAVKEALYDESKPWTNLFAWAEVQTGVNRLNLFLGLTVFTVFYLVIGYGTLLLSNFIGFLYPAYASIKAVESHSKDDDTKWLTYWVVFSFVTIVEFPAQCILSWIPFYSLVKTIFFVWCYIPIHNNGSIVMYNRFIRPYFLKHQSDIDQAVNDLSKKAAEVAADKILDKKN